MANRDAPDGFKPYGGILPGHNFTVQDNTPSNAIEPGDAVVRGSDGNFSRLTDDTAANGLAGFAMSRQAASATGALTICLAGGGQKFSAQDDAGATPALALRGEDCDILTTAPDTTDGRGHSKHEIKLSTHAASAKVVRLLDILDVAEPGYSKTAVNARWVVEVNAAKLQVVI